jgi:hypothetical protein
MKNQNLLLNAIRNQLKNGISIIDEVADILNISYDAAHRRISNKSKFSIDEIILISKHYKISLDQLFNQKESLIVEKTKKIEKLNDFKAYFEKTNQILNELNPKETTLYYAAKDIPMNYAVAGTLFSKFKFYIWLNLLNKEETSSFENFRFEETILNDNNTLKHFFDNSKTHEVWNDTTINSSLQQVYYFFEAGLINYNNALNIINDIKCIIDSIELKCESNTTSFQLYYNELLILNNSALFISKDKSAFFLPYNALGYYVTNDKTTCKEQEQYILNQLHNSKSLNQSGRKDRKVFFNRMHQKIDFYKTKIENYLNE